MRRCSLCFAGLIVALAGCGGPSGGGAAPGASAATQNPQGDKASSGAQSAAKDAAHGAGAADADADATEGPREQEKPAQKPAESPFHIAAKTDEALPMRAVGDALYVFNSHFVAEVTPEGVKPVVAKEMDEEKAEAFGLPFYGKTIDLGGSRGDSPFLVYLTDNGRVGYNVLYQRKGASWRRVKATGDGTGYVGMRPWKDGRTLGLLVGFGFNTVSWKPGFAVISGPPATMPELTAGEKPCAARIVPSSLWSLPSGEVFIVGSACVVQKENGEANPMLEDRLLVERWAPGQVKGTIDELPIPAALFTTSNDSDAPMPAFAGASPNDIYLNLASSAKEPTLVHFDGSAWKRFDAPSKSEPVSSIAGAKDGALYAVAGNGLYKKAQDRDWESVSAPAGGGVPVEVLAQSNGAVWVAAETDDGGALWTTGVPPARVEKITSGATKQDKYVLPKAATSKCKTNFAMLYAFTKVTPPDYDFPLTRQAVKGKKQFKDARFVVIEENGRKYFGAILPNYSMGKALVEVIEKEVKGAKPALLCHEPKVVRELKLNLDTGEPIK